MSAVFGVSVEYAVYVSVLLTKQQRRKVSETKPISRPKQSSCVRRIANLGSFVIYEINLQCPPKHL